MNDPSYIEIQVTAVVDRDLMEKPLSDRLFEAIDRVRKALPHRHAQESIPASQE